jgi:hypothetical protein
VRVLAGGRAVDHAEADGVLGFETVAGETYTLAVDGAPETGPAFGAGAGEPLTYTGPVYLWNIAPADRLTIRLGLADREVA